MYLQTIPFKIINKCFLGYQAVPRTILLHNQAYQEEGIPFLSIDDKPQLYLPLVAHYPRSYVSRAAELNHSKKYDYNFLGVLFNSAIYEQREWIVDFAQRNFTHDSYYSITDAQQYYQPLGIYDYTLEDLGKRFVPRDHSLVSEKGFFDDTYFQVMCQSRFTLCPAGDAPWSMRFFESIMCKSIPVLEKPRHSGRNLFERAIGYRFYTLSDQLEYREDWVEENYNKFYDHQTLLSKTRSASSRLENFPTRTR